MKKRRIIVLGSTGSIGESTFKVLSCYKSCFEVVALAARSNVRRLAQQARLLGAEFAVTSDAAKLPELKAELAGSQVGACGSLDKIFELLDRCDVLLCAIVGTAGLPVVLEALKRGKTVALASKEVLVMAGEAVRRVLAENPDAEIVPVDSEHSALFQCMSGRKRNEVRELVLTASGGAFYGMKREEICRATLADALKHPTWSMGTKITVDSATLMNKALEIIEAHYLFDFEAEKIKTVIHPQSVVHSLVRLVDGSLIAQMSRPDMRFAIQYALSYPERWDGGGELPELDWQELLQLSFQEPDRTVFPSLDYAYEAIRRGGVVPAVLNAANEEAVAEFCRGTVALPVIWETVEKIMADAPDADGGAALPEIIEADKWARVKAREFIAAKRR